MVEENLINEFLEKKSLDALKVLLETSDEKKAEDASIELANVLCSGSSFSKISDSNSDGESKLISSFNNNLVLLIQKTWVEKCDEELKAQVLYHLEEFTKQMSEKSYSESYAPFFSIVDDVVYLMFGNQTRGKDFDEYALRIDPEFGIFWWYMKSLPRDTEWSSSRCRIAILLGMYFLANY